MTTRIRNTDAELVTRTAQLSQLKNAFFHNLKLLKERDAEASKQISEIDNFKKNLHTRDLIISEVQSSLNRCQSELSISKLAQKHLTEELETLRKECTQKEIALREQHTATLNSLKQSEAAERMSLQSALTRLQSDLDAEKIRSACELREALEDVAKVSENEAARAAQKQFGLELQLNMSVEMCARATKARENALKELDVKNAELMEMQSRAAIIQQELDSVRLQLHDTKTELKLAEQKRSNIEAEKIRMESGWQAEKEELFREKENLRAQLDRHMNELVAVNSSKEEIVSTATAERNRLLDSLSREQQEAKNAIAALEEANTARQLAERTAKAARAESARLRKDLEQALLTSFNVTKDSTVKCKHEHLLVQLDRLQNNCDRLENENARLKHAVSAMSEQARETAARQNELSVSTKPQANQIKLIEERLRSENQNLNEKLHTAVKVIHQLARDKNLLTELSNRLQAQLRASNISNNDKPPSSVSNSSKLSVSAIIPPSKTLSPKRLPNKSRDPNNLPPVYSHRNRDVQDPGPLSPNTRVNSSPTQQTDISDALSSVLGKESVAGVFNLLDDPVPDYGGRSTDLPGTVLTARGNQKSIRPKKSRQV
ncbi:unnamed protein product [Calicophoron daubneyi]|uniref:Uncharacterized protein n=1 Tax=Calicophoron daubneyi TaxID=300641 RepID=A0AAV2TU00_CALDB